LVWLRAAAARMSAVFMRGWMVQSLVVVISVAALGAAAEAPASESSGSRVSSAAPPLGTCWSLARRNGSRLSSPAPL
jgi:hypothetical protein